MEYDAIMKYFLAFLLLLSCKHHAAKEPIAQDQENIRQIKEKLALYENLSRKYFDANNSIPLFSCDALEFVGYLVSAQTNITAFESAKEPGAWYRTPEKNCYDTGRSNSDISRDGLTGLAYFSAYTDNFGIAERTLQYGYQHNWYMGRGEITATFFTFNMRRLYALLADKGGYHHSDLLKLPEVWAPGLKGYEAHLQVVDAIIRLKLGSISPELTARVYEHYKVNPDNFIFNFAYHKVKDGNYAESMNILLNPVYFPNDRLPTRKLDHCADYLWQREKFEWTPCDDDRELTGVDFIVAARLLLKELNYV